MNNIKKN